MLFPCVFPVFLSLVTFATAFTVQAPGSVSVDGQFLVNWTWLTSESGQIVVVLNDVSKAPDCPTDTSKRERSYVVLDLANRAGSLGFYVDHPGTFQACAFTYDDKSGKTPVSSIITNIAKSKTFEGSVLAMTVTVQPSGSSTSSPQNFGTNGGKSSSIAGPVIGGVIGGMVLLFLLVWLVLFRMKNYHVIRLPPDSPSQSSHPLMASHSRSPSTSRLPDMSNVHPGVSPFPHPNHTPNHSVTNLRTVSDAKRQYRPNAMAESLSSPGAGGSSSPGMSPPPMPRKGHNRGASTETGSQSMSTTTDSTTIPPTYVSGAGPSRPVMEKGRRISNR
ncbi:hypothetical protein PQX77_017064 [Marasmius sp. AFHP31]|nr:hypothetical protein PQX77_017064 [Marasmius sp. AFHP31]